MNKEKSKSHFAGIRMTKKESAILSKLQQSSNLSKTEILLRGLEILGEYYSLGLDKRPLSEELRHLEEEAIHHFEALKRIRRKEESIKEMVQELSAVNEIIDKYQGDKSALIQILLEIQSRNRWLHKPALMWVSERLGVPMSQILHIASFYKAFSLKPRGKHFVRVCLGTACHVRGGPRILEAAERTLEIKAGETTADLNLSLERVNCLECCALGPVMVVDDEYHVKLSSAKAEKILKTYD